MALTKQTVQREDEVGDDFAVYADGAGDYHQSNVIIGEGDAPMGLAANPLRNQAVLPTALAYSTAVDNAGVPQSNADGVAGAAIARLSRIHFTASKSLTAARWLWIVDRATMAGAVPANLVYAPLLIPEGGMVEKIWDRENVNQLVTTATDLSVGISSESDTYVQDGVGFFEITWEV